MTDTAPLELWRETVRPEWIDYNGHMNVAYYMLIFDHAADAFYDHVGLGRAYRTRTDNTTFAVEAHITYDRELVAGDAVRCTTQLVGVDDKRIHHFHQMYHAEKGYLAATVEFLALHVDLAVRRVSPMPAEIRAPLEALAAAHRDLPLPDHVGRGIRSPSPRRG